MICVIGYITLMANESKPFYRRSTLNYVVFSCLMNGLIKAGKIFDQKDSTSPLMKGHLYDGLFAAYLASMPVPNNLKSVVIKDVSVLLLCYGSELL
jgi:hypothetical protein